jgi:hypothetical protein
VTNDFETRLSATTWRFLDLTGQPCAMVLSREGRAVWHRTNDALKEQRRTQNQMGKLIYILKASSRLENPCDSIVGRTDRTPSDSNA